MTNYAAQRHYRMPATGEVWRHYKGTTYTIVGISRDDEGFAVVVYTERHWHGKELPPLFNQRLDRWHQEIDSKIDRTPRFVYQGQYCADCAFIREPLPK